MKRKYARIGDKVRIRIPKKFVRCGYPLDFSSIRERDSAKITEVIAKICTFADLDKGDPYVNRYLEKAVISDILRKENFGGKDRIIVEKDVPELLNAEATVLGRRFVKTGKYCRGYYSSSFYGGDDYQPAYLDNEKRHEIYSVELTDSRIADFCPDLWDKLEISATNCEMGQGDSCRDSVPTNSITTA